MYLNITDLLLAVFPVVITILGLYFKMNTLIVRQDEKIATLQREIIETKRAAEKNEERFLHLLEGIQKDVVAIKVHFSSCVNFKTNS
tara:strand:- start:328 stop:588 length:261 start_codon:yes stop_codon:yes gene_type:complete